MDDSIKKKDLARSAIAPEGNEEKIRPRSGLYASLKTSKNSFLEKPREFTIKNKENIYIMTISKDRNNKYISFKCKEINDVFYYESQLSIDNLYSIISIFRLSGSMESVYNVILDIFDWNQVCIKELYKNKYIKIRMIFGNFYGKEQNFEIYLNYRENKDLAIKELKEKIKKMKEDEIELKEKLKQKDEMEDKYNQAVEKINMLDTKLTKSKIEIEKLKNNVKNLQEEKEKVEEELKKALNPSNSRTESGFNIGEVIYGLQKSTTVGTTTLMGFQEIASNLYNEKDTNTNNKDNTIPPPPINQNSYIFESDPENLKIIQKISSSRSDFDNSFALYTSSKEDNHLIMVFPTSQNSLEFFDFSAESLIKSIPNAHNSVISCVRHYFCKNLEADLIMSGSVFDRQIKIWNAETFNCILRINEAHQTGYMYSVCMIIDNKKKQNFIVSSCDSNKESLKLWDFKGKMIKKIFDSSEEETVFIDTYYDLNVKKFFIITGNKKYIKSFDYLKNKVYKKYLDREINSNSLHVSVLVITPNDINQIKENKIKMIESSKDGYIRVWGFHSGIMLKKIKMENKINGICLWKENMILVCLDDKGIALLNNDFGLSFNEEDNKEENKEEKGQKKTIIEEKAQIMKYYAGHEGGVCSIKKIICDDFGECMVSQQVKEGPIILWGNI